MDAKTGEVYALANDKTFDPSQPAAGTSAAMGNPAVSNPYEPGSVNKIVTALCAIDQNITSPLDVHQVRGSIRVADRTIGDAWYARHAAAHHDRHLREVVERRHADARAGVRARTSSPTC